MKNLEVFKKSLAETILWCSRRADVSEPKDCFRSEVLRPPIFEESRFAIAESVISSRAFHVKSEDQEITIPKNLGNGKLMIFFPENNLFDGAAELNTDGFFDDYNTPPWDTWVGYFEDDLPESYTKFDECDSKYLVSWIPESFIELADVGIIVNPEECIMWLSDSKTKLAEILHKEKLL